MPIDEIERLRLAELERLRLMRLQQNARLQAQALAQAAASQAQNAPAPAAPREADAASPPPPGAAEVLGWSTETPDALMQARKDALRARNPEAADALRQLEALYAAQVPTDDARVSAWRQKLVAALDAANTSSSGQSDSPLAAFSTLFRAPQAGPQPPELDAASAEPRPARKLGTGQLFEITL